MGTTELQGLPTYFAASGYIWNFEKEPSVSVTKWLPQSMWQSTQWLPNPTEQKICHQEGTYISNCRTCPQRESLLHLFFVQNWTLYESSPGMQLNVCMFKGVLSVGETETMQMGTQLDAKGGFLSGY